MRFSTLFLFFLFFILTTLSAAAPALEPWCPNALLAGFKFLLPSEPLTGDLSKMKSLVKAQKQQGTSPDSAFSQNFLTHLKSLTQEKMTAWSTDTNIIKTEILIRIEKSKSQAAKFPTESARLNEFISYLNGVLSRPTMPFNLIMPTDKISSPSDLEFAKKMLIAKSDDWRELAQDNPSIAAKANAKAAAVAATPIETMTVAEAFGIYNPAVSTAAIASSSDADDFASSPAPEVRSTRRSRHLARRVGRSAQPKVQVSVKVQL